MSLNGTDVVYIVMQLVSVTANFLVDAIDGMIEAIGINEQGVRQCHPPTHRRIGSRPRRRSDGVRLCVSVSSSIVSRT